MSLSFSSKVFTLFFGLNASLAFSQEILSFNVEPEKIIEGTEAVFRINFAKTSSSASAWCGLKIDFGNGDTKNIRIGENGDKDLNFSIKYTYPNVGTYSASVVGEYMSRGLKSAIGCAGPKRTYKVVVTANKQEKSEKPEVVVPKRPLVTADLPTSFNQPIDQDRLQAISASNPGFRDAIQGYTMKKVESVTLMMMQANQGEPYAQFFYGLAHTETWTNIYDKKQACYWFRQSAVAGVSQARLFLATKAFKDKECFDVPPTLEQAKVWAQLASMSTDPIVKADAEKLLQEILRFQIERGGR
jgi:hypothetical protein